MRNSCSDLYERDYYAWLQDQIRALRERRIEDVDWKNVAEEIEDWGKSERRAVESQLARLVEHLLKLQYTYGLSRDYNARIWRLSIRGARFAINKLLKESPSLRLKLPEMFPAAYYLGCLRALRDPELPEDEIPELSPWTLEQVMDDSSMADHTLGNGG